MATLTSYTSPANGTAAIYTLITQLLLAGWRITAWSDATTLTSGVSLSLNPYGSSGSGAGNLGNTSAWFRIAAGDGSREWMFQRSTTDVLWTMQRGRLGFTGGSPNATTPGTDATSYTLFSAATAFPTMGSWAISLDNTTYSWTAFMTTTGGGNVKTILADETLATGTYPTADTDPSIAWVYYNPTGFTNTSFALGQGTTAVGYKRFRHTLAGAGNTRICYAFYLSGDGQQFTPGLGNNTTQVAPEPFNGTEIPLRIMVCGNGVTSNTTGYCGFASRHRWGTVFGRSNLQTLQDGSTYWIYMAGVWVPWDSSTPTP